MLVQDLPLTALFHPHHGYLGVKRSDGTIGRGERAGAVAGHYGRIADGVPLMQTCSSAFSLARITTKLNGRARGQR